MNLCLRLATPDDLPSLLEIEAACFGTPNWQTDDFSRYTTVVAEVDSKIAGFLVSRQIYSGLSSDAPEREILNVAVAPPFRRIGIATSLLKRELQFKAVHFLEVRESNQAAQALYRKIGFIEIDRRPQYYTSPEETAIVMQLK